MRKQRRQFLQVGLAVPATALLSACQAPEPDEDQQKVQAQTRRFFTAEEQQCIEAATARLIPSGADGSGAREAAVAVFIDRQLAGPYGRAETWYMQPPFASGTGSQGYQLDKTPAQIYRLGIRSLNEHCKRAFDGKVFADLSEEDQDKVLQALDKEDIQLAEVPTKRFFAILWQNTQEGYLADPMYGGNRNFVGWKLIGYPGPRYNYVTEVTQYGKPYPLPEVGLLGRDGTRTLEDL